MDTFFIPSLSPSIDTPDSNVYSAVYEDDSTSVCLGFNLPESPSTLGDTLCGVNLNSMDLDPIAALFAFNSTCNSPNYTKSEHSNHSLSKSSQCKPTSMDTSEMNGSSYKQAYHSSNYHPNQSHCFPGSQSPNYSQGSSLSSPNYSNYTQNTQPPMNGISYSFHPQIQMNPSPCSSASHHSNYYNPQIGSDHYPNAQQSLFPAASMSVNLSMNMTMGFSSEPQWSTQTINYPNNYQNQGPAPVYHSHTPTYTTPSPNTYTFTAEFRPTDPIVLPPIEKEFPGVCAIKSQSPHYSNKSPNENNCRYNTYNKSKLSPCSDVKSPLSVSSQNLCRICGKTYARPSTLKTHLRTHSGERPYRCHTCSKSFSQAANLTAHIRTHSGEKPFRCPICERRFSQSSSVTTHMRTHSGERPYRCCMCKKAFSDSSTLTKHLRIHSGEKPYQCKLCLLRFSQSGNLNRHMRIHSNIV